MADPALFSVRNAQYNTRIATELTPPGQVVRTGVRTVDATCLSCSHEWTAQAGVTGLRNILNGVHLECPKCEARGAVHSKAFA